MRAAWSGRSSGDLRPTTEPGRRALAEFAAAVAGPRSSLERVHWVEQVHGRAVRTVEGATRDLPAPGAGLPRVVRSGRGDALVSREAGTALCVLVADCAPLALASPEGVFAAVHAGWRGLRAGVVDAAVEAMAAGGATSVVGALGPCIHPCCYEFGAGDLEEMAGALGPSVRGRTRGGRPALDLPAAVVAALSRAGAGQAGGVARCTGCGGGSFSHRVSRSPERQALVVWRESGPAGR